jgi:UDP-N-acetylmuramoyl-tripeptide--D-alanyl-D-alanine ligase
MSLWNAKDATAATGGRATRDFAVSGVSIDTRTLQPGDLFVALSAARDGHDFVAQALASGAAAALVSRIPDGVAPDAPLLIVDDVLAALCTLGQAARARSAARVIGVTGSVGKTSTKEMLRDVLSRQGRTHAAEASYNNHWGVPLTLARMPRDTEFAVIEMGMNHAGEIEPLSRLAAPHVALITTVAAAHLEAFDSIDAIAREKAAIFDGLVPGGIAVVNGDLATLPVLRDHATALKVPLRTFGESTGNDVHLQSVRLTGDITIAEARVNRDTHLFKLASAGRHFATNAAGVLAVLEALDADVTQGARDLVHWQPPAGRGLREVIRLDPVEDADMVLLDDAYNANPTSLVAALEVLAAATPGVAPGAGGRRIAVLGDMLELGADSAAIHRDLAKCEFFETVDLVHTSGALMAHLHAALPEGKRGECVENVADLASRAHQLIAAGDVVLVKGSKGSRVSRVVDAIRKLGHAPATHS